MSAELLTQIGDAMQSAFSRVLSADGSKDSDYEWEMGALEGQTAIDRWTAVRAASGRSAGFIVMDPRGVAGLDSEGRFRMFPTREAAMHDARSYPHYWEITTKEVIT